MDKKQIVLGIIALWVSIPVWGREITIEECYRKAQANYPLIKQYDLIEKSREYSVSNANKGYLPQISFRQRLLISPMLPSCRSIFPVWVYRVSRYPH